MNRVQTNCTVAQQSVRRKRHLSGKSHLVNKPHDWWDFRAGIRLGRFLFNKFCKALSSSENSGRISAEGRLRHDVRAEIKVVLREELLHNKLQIGPRCCGRCRHFPVLINVLMCFAEQNDTVQHLKCQKAVEQKHIKHETLTVDVN